MSLIKQALLQIRLPLLEARRFRGKINIQRPRKPHYERQLIIDVSKPYIFDTKRPEAEKCTIGKQYPWHRVVENPFERILARECLNWFNRSKVVVFLHMNSIKMANKSKIYVALRKQDMHLRMYGRKIVSMATEGTHLEIVNKLFTSQQEIIFAQNDNVAAILRILKKAPEMVVMAGIVHGKLMSKSELVAYSQLPDLQTARSQLCAVLQSAGSGIVSQLNQHQQLLISHLDQHVQQLKEPQTAKEESQEKDPKVE